MTDKTNTEKPSLKKESADLLKSVKDFAITVGEDCPEGHRRDPKSGACLPLGSTDYTAFTRSLNVDDGDLWRGLQDKGSEEAPLKEAALMSAEDMEELESCAAGTTFSFIRRECISVEEAEAEDSDEFAMVSDTDYLEEDASAPGQGGHEEITMMQPEGRRDTVNHECPANMFFDYKQRQCIPLNKDTVMASEDFDGDFKKAMAMYARLAMTTCDPRDGHKHVATLDEDGNGITSISGYDNYAHSHTVKKFVVQDAEAGDRTSKHPGVAVPEEHEINKPSWDQPSVAEEVETSAVITTKQRKALPDSSFGVPGKRKFPLDTCARVRNAMARFNQSKGLTSGEKATLRRKILSAAKKCGIEVRNFAKATTADEFAEVLRDLWVSQRVMSQYAAEDQNKGPCPPGMNWDTAAKKCKKTKAFYDLVKAEANHAEIIAKDPEGRKDTVGFQCPEGQFFDFKNRQCLPLDPSQKKGTTTSKASEEQAQSRKLTPQPEGKPARLPQGCPKGTIWDKDLQDCKPLDSRKKTKSEEEEAQKKSCEEDEFWNPVLKKCMPKKGAFKKMKSKEETAADLVGAPAGKVKLPSDCPPGTMWDGKLKVCKEMDTRKKVTPGGQELDPQHHASAEGEVESMSLAKIIQSLDQIIKEEVAAGRREKDKVAAKDLPNEAFPPSLVSSTRRSLLHHSPNVEDAYEHGTVDISRLRNSLARVAKLEGYSAKAVEDAQDHLLYHARQAVKEYLVKS